MEVEGGRFVGCSVRGQTRRRSSPRLTERLRPDCSVRHGLDPDKVGGAEITGDPSVLLAAPPRDGGTPAWNGDVRRNCSEAVWSVRQPCGGVRPVVAIAGDPPVLLATPGGWTPRLDRTATSASELFRRLAWLGPGGWIQALVAQR